MKGEPRAWTAVVHKYFQLQPRLALAAKNRQWKRVAELFPKVRDAKTAMLKSELKAERKERRAA